MGGAFLLVRDRARAGSSRDGRETARARQRPTLLAADGSPLPTRRLSADARRCPERPPARSAHRKHGQCRRSLFAPAIALAENARRTPRLHALIAKETRLPPAARAYLLDAAGKPRAVGSILRNTAYAATLRRIAAEGADAFYSGAVAQDIVDTVRAHQGNPGDITLADLAAYRVKVRTPVCDTYRRYRVCGMPLPSSGGLTVLQILKLLEPYSIADMGPASFWSVHFLSEAGRLAYADRGVYEADPDFYTPPAGLLDPAYLRAVATHHDDGEPRPRRTGRSASDAAGDGAQGRVGTKRRRGLSIDVAHRRRRSLRQCSINDDDDRAGVRQPSDDEERLPAQ